MVEKQTIASKDIVGLTIVDHYPIAIEFGSSIWGTRVERCGLFLRNLLYLAKQLTG